LLLQELQLEPHGQVPWCLGVVLAVTSDLALAQSAITLLELVVKQMPNMVDELISRRESATRVTVEV
jgi:hypothetical protein